MIRQTYRLAAGACAALVWRVPALERPFVELGARTWSTPGLGRFYRSAAFRLAERLRLDRTPFRPVIIGRQRLVLDVTEFTAGPLYFGGAVYEPATTQHFVQTLGPGRVVVDIGANHGYFTLLAASLVGDTGHVVAFEPNPRVFDQLETHVRLNGLESCVSLQSCALGDRVGVVPLYVSQVPSNSGLSSLNPNPDLLDTGGLSRTGTVTVPLDTFDRFFASSCLASVDLVKIDVEGAERDVVAGMANALGRRAVRSLIVETTWASDAHRALCDAGYEPRPLDAVGSLLNVLYTAPC